MVSTGAKEQNVRRDVSANRLDQPLPGATDGLRHLACGARSGANGVGFAFGMFWPGNSWNTWSLERGAVDDAVFINKVFNLAQVGGTG